MMTLMKGYLTYALAFLAIAWGAFGYFKGLIDGNTALEAVWGGLAAFGIRRAITNPE